MELLGLIINIDWVYELPIKRNWQYVAHFVVGTAIQLFSLLFKYKYSKWVGFALVLVLAFWKEYEDCRRHGMPDEWDIVATIIGPVIIMLIIKTKLFK